MTLRRVFRSRTILGLALAVDLLTYSGPPGPFDYSESSLEMALAAQASVTQDWLRLDGVVGTAIGVDGAGHAVLKVYLTSPGAAALPNFIVGVEVVPEVTGRFTALSTEDPSDPATGGATRDADAAADRTANFPRPVPIGVSTGHPNVTAGTIGARVTDGERVFALSNNHIFAANNGGRTGDPMLQPGSVDGGRNPDDAFGSLYDFEPLYFCRAFACPPNGLDAAIALTTTDDLGLETPDEGYGAPRRWTAEAELGMAVQKYGRTTGQTHGRVTGIHATIDVRYGQATARFEDQIVISGNRFSAGGDSGSLVVTQGVLMNDRRPVGLLFAGTTTTTLANPIDRVLDRFGVSIDGD